jgi:acyl-CoA ligase (AMP-forming) (exosortase A-associated)
MNLNLCDLLEAQAGIRQAAPALSLKDATLSYGQLRNQALAFRDALSRLGLRRGDRVGIYLDKRLETVTAIFGTAAAGGVFVPINPILRPTQVAYILNDCDVRVLVTSPERLEQLQLNPANSPTLEVVVVVGDRPASPPDQSVRILSWASLQQEASPPPAPAVHPRVDADVAAIFYTSGSTGSPKGVVLSHRNLLVGGESVSHYLGNTADDVILSLLPLSFDAGFSQLTTAFTVGAHVILHNYLLADDAIRLCTRHRVTGITGVPPLWIQLADRPWPAEAARSIRYFANTGGRMPKATLDRLRALLPGAQPFLMYGLTEAFRSTYLPPAEVDRRPDSIGKAIPNAEILVVRPDGSPCDPLEHGELVHRGPLVSLGYWRDEERTRERFRPAPQRDPGIIVPELAVWSGDVVYRDAEGFLYFVGRRDEMIKTSGYRVSPTEIEEAAYATGLVRDAVALGLEDPRLGQQIALVVSPLAGRELTPETLLAQLKPRLPLYMLPARIELRAELPRSPNGKFDRPLIRRELTG